MYLGDVMVLPAGHDREQIRALRQSSDHVLDIVRHYLPAKYELGGLRRVVIELGRGNDGVVGQPHGPVGTYAMPGFDLESYFRLPQETQEETIAGCVETALLALAARYGAAIGALEATMRCVRESGFRLETELGCSRWFAGENSGWRSSGASHRVGCMCATRSGTGWARCWTQASLRAGPGS